MISGIILASGLSKRMGTDKLLLTVEGVPVIERVIAAASDSRLREVILVCTSAAVASIGEKYGARIVINNAPELGQSNSIRLGVRNSDRASAGYMFLAGDQPFINKNVINGLIEGFGTESSAVVPFYNGIRGNPVIFNSRFKEKLMGLSGDSGGRVLLDELKDSIIKVGFTDEKAGMDIDTREEYEALVRQEDGNG